MKKIFIVFFAVLFISGCETKRNELVIQDDDSRVFLPAAQVDSIPVLISPATAAQLSDEFAAVFGDYKSELKDNQYALTAYNLYIDENGKILKITRTPGKMMWANQSEQSFNDIEKRFADIFQKIKLSPAMNNGMPSKYRTALMISAAFKDSKVICSLFSEIKGLNKSDENISGANAAKTPAAPVDPSEYFVNVESSPEPIGGMEAIAANVIYPEIAKRAGIEGRVFVKAFIDENGDVVKTDVLKGIGAGCDQAAVNAIMKTKFKPGMQKGKAVKVQVAIPIIFKLR